MQNREDQKAYPPGNHKALKISISKFIVAIKLDRGDHLIYHSLFGRPLRVNREVWDMMQRFKTAEQIKYALDANIIKRHRKNISKLIDSHYLIKDGTDEYGLLQLKYRKYREECEKSFLTGCLINSLRFEMASYCNFKCRHCFAKIRYDWNRSSMLNFNVARLAIDGTVNMIKRNKGNHLHITYWGGEPLLNWKTIAKTVEYAEEATMNTPIEVGQGVITNASLVTEEIAAFLKKHKLNVSVSLDGLEHDNDRFRMYANGRGTFKNIIRGMDILKKYGIYFIVQLTLNDFNLSSIERFIDFIRGKYSCSLIIGPVEYEKITPSFDRHPAREKARRSIEMKVYAHKKGLDLSIDASKEVRDIINGTPRLFGCGKAACLYIKPSGMVTPCQKINLPLGNVRQIERIPRGRNYARVLRRSIDKVISCRNCEIEAFCSGGCAGIAEFYSGDMYDTSDPLQRAYYCEFKIQFVREMLRYLGQKKDCFSTLA